MVRDILKEKKDIIEERLSWLLTADILEHRRLYEAMNYSLLAGGKRIRPALFLMVLDVLGQESMLYLDAACAIECVHTYSLIHDDLPQMDNDPYRRGKPTNHMVYGAGMATMAGDGLLTYAFGLLAGMNGIPADTRCRLISILAAAAGPAGMVGGQAQDIESENKQLTIEMLHTMDRCKTGCLLTAPVDMAAVIGGADGQTQSALHAYGLHLGQLFQITDDLLDCTGTLEEMGKEPGQDAVMKKSTYVSLLGPQEARQMAEKEASRAAACLNALGKKAQPLRDVAFLLLSRTH